MSPRNIGTILKIFFVTQISKTVKNLIVFSAGSDFFSSIVSNILKKFQNKIEFFRPSAWKCSILSIILAHKSKALVQFEGTIWKVFLNLKYLCISSHLSWWIFNIIFLQINQPFLVEYLLFKMLLLSMCCEKKVKKWQKFRNMLLNLLNVTVH